MRKRKKRNPLERVALRYPNFMTVKELSRVLQTTRTAIKNWVGYWKDFQQYKIEGFPELIVHGKHFVFRLEEIERYLGVEFDNPYLVDPLMTAGQVAKRLRRSRRTIFKWIKEGRLQVVRFGIQTLRVEQNEVERFEKENEGWLKKYNPPVEVVQAREQREAEQQRRKEKIRSDMKGIGQEMRSRIFKLKKRVEQSKEVR